MPANTANQQITLPIGTDAADAPQAFIDQTADLENRLVQRYLSDADRTARNPAPNLGELSIVTANTWYDRWTGAKWLPATEITAFKTATQTINNSVTITNDTQLLVPLPTINSDYAFEMAVFYISSTVADFKFDFTVPAGASITYGVSGLAPGAVATTGDGQFDAASAVTIALGGAGDNLMAVIQGGVSVGATAGNLQFRWAQNTLEVSNTQVQLRSWIRLRAIQ